MKASPSTSISPPWRMRFDAIQNGLGLWQQKIRSTLRGCAGRAEHVPQWQPILLSVPRLGCDPADLNAGACR